MDGDLSGVMGFGIRLVRPFEISPRRGAKTSLYLATSPDVVTKTGMYWVRSKPGHMSRHARDDERRGAAVDESEGCWSSAGFAPGLSRAQPASVPTTWVMQPQSEATSSGSIAGNMAMRSWFRPSLR